MSYHNLTNEEIVFLYYVSSSIVKQYENTFADKAITQTLPTDKGVAEITTSFSSEFIDEIKQSKHYTVMKDVQAKLKPIFLLIKDVEPEMVKEIDDLFNFKIDE